MKRTSRRRWSPVGPGAWAAAGGAAAIILICTLNSLLWINRPFPGFFVWANLFVPAVGDTDWSGYEAGIPFQSRLVTSNEQPVGSAAEVYRFAASVPVGTAVRYRFAVRPGAPLVSLTIPTMRFSVAEYLWTLGNYLAVGTLLTVLGFIVYILRPDAPAARGMLSATVTWGLYLVTSADIFGPGWFRPLFLVLQAVGPVAVVHLGLTFPVERAILRRHPRVLRTLYLASVAVGLVSNAVFYRTIVPVLIVDRFIPVAGVILIGLLAHAFVFPPSPAARQRVKIAALGGCAAFLTPVAGFSLFYFRGISFPLNFVTLPMALFPITIGYAIVKHDLFEVDAIIRRTVAWVILTVVIAALYLGGVGVLDLLLAGRSGRAGQVVFLLAIVVLFNPLRNRVQAAVDFLFARDRYDYRKTVGEASQALAALLDLDAVVGRILRTITETIHVEYGALWLRADGAYQLQAVAGIRPAVALPQQLDGTSALLGRLEQSPRGFLTEESADASVNVDDDALTHELQSLGATLMVPMTFEDRLIGFLALGGKQSGAFYSREDLELLRTLANQGAVAVENARSYRALLHANEELRAAQSRLIETERFAAIGELSAAVAHGIRNPLAGIKAAAQFASMDLPAEHPLRENITDIISEADILEGRIRTLLDFAKPFEPHPTACRVDHIIAGAIGLLRSQMKTHGVEVTSDIDPLLPAAMLDEAQIEQVLLALLSNAVEAMPSGGTITVQARLVADRIRIEVADTGPGIPPDQLERVFKLFFTTKSSGTGFGLAVAKKIIERHGGTIAVESTLGQGARFIIELPLHP